MIVAEPSGLRALGAVQALDPFVDRVDVRTTELAIDAIAASTGRHGSAGEGARAVVASRNRLTVSTGPTPIVTFRLDPPAGSCVALSRNLKAPFYLTNHGRAIHEVKRLVPGDIVTPAIALGTLVRWELLSRQDAQFRLETLVSRWRGVDAALGDRAPAALEESMGVGRK